MALQPLFIRGWKQLSAYRGFFGWRNVRLVIVEKRYRTAVERPKYRIVSVAQ